VKSKETVCFGAVLHVRRRWVSKLAKKSFARRGSIGHWTFWASVHVLGKPRLVMISKEFYEELVEKGSRQLPDACLHPHVGAPPPSPTVKE
jgi:hypothetical protein